MLKYIKDCLSVAFLFLCCAAIFALTFFLYGLDLYAVLYPTILCLVLLAVVCTVTLLRRKRKHKQLASLLSAASETIDRLPEPATLAEQDYINLIRSLQKEIRSLKTADDAKYRETVDYYTVWAHQIKTPIASMKLTLQGEDSDVSRRMSSDLFKIEQYVEMVLTFLRLGSCSTDYVFKSCPLDGIVRQSVKRFSGEFIVKKLRLDYGPVEGCAVTDEKWLSFVIEQIISNAVKYTAEGGIKIFTKEPLLLYISDTGIGIQPEDIPRIFENGYTGQNGRYDKRATGIGLYLCRRICDNIGVRIAVESVPAAGTTVILDMRSKNDRLLTRM